MTTSELGRAIDALSVEPEPEATTVTEELIAIRQISKRLDGLDEAARQRVMHWLTARYGEQ